MLRALTALEFDREPRLRDAMLRDRADQFARRLGWPVHVDAMGRERDEYDDLGPLYVVWQGADGGHGGSLRLLPTTGPTMLADHFPHLTDGVRFESPLIWECTRFCLAPGAPARVAPALMLGAAEAMRAYGLTHLLGVFDDAMTRVYARIGATPDLLGRRGGLSAGLWHEDGAMRARLLARAGMTEAMVAEAFARDRGGEGWRLSA